MLATTRPLPDLTAGDLMTRNLVSVSYETSLREAARLLLLHQISGLPVVEPGGGCVGVLSTTDILRWSLQQHGASLPSTGPQPNSYAFQLKQRGPRGEESVLCTLPLDVCSPQRREAKAGREERIVCRHPHEVLADWQIVEVEDLPAANVGQFMTPDPVTVAVDTPLRELAWKMLDAHVHRVIVVDRLHRPVGIVSSTDIMAGIARGDRSERGD